MCLVNIFLDQRGCSGEGYSHIMYLCWFGVCCLTDERNLISADHIVTTTPFVSVLFAHAGAVSVKHLFQLEPLEPARTLPSSSPPSISQAQSEVLSCANDLSTSANRYFYESLSKLSQLRVLAKASSTDLSTDEVPYLFVTIRVSTFLLFATNDFSPRYTQCVQIAKSILIRSFSVSKNNLRLEMGATCAFVPWRFQAICLADQMLADQGGNDVRILVLSISGTISSLVSTQQLRVS